MIRRLSTNAIVRAVALILVLVTTLVMVLPLSSGCSGTASSNTFINLLSLVPASAVVEGAPFSFTLIDYARIYRDAGIVFTTPQGLFDEVKKDNIALSAAASGSYITGYGAHANESINFEKYLGYNVTDIDAEIQFGMPPKIGVAALGRFDSSVTRNALSHQDDWPSWVKDAYVTEEYGGITIHNWGNGFEIHLNNTFSPPHLDGLGRAIPLAVTDKYLFYTPSLEDIKLMIDASEGIGKTLADLPQYASIANGLSDLGAYTGVIGDESQTIGPEDYEDSDPGPVLKHFLTFGSGPGRDEKGTYIALVLCHENDDNAKANELLFRQRIEDPSGIAAYVGESWNQMITDVRIDVDGKVLLAKLYTESISLLPNWFFSQYGLLVHE
jgi:hypothetical protein